MRTHKKRTLRYGSEYKVHKIVANLSSAWIPDGWFYLVHRCVEKFCPKNGRRDKMSFSSGENVLQLNLELNQANIGFAHSK